MVETGNVIMDEYMDSAHLKLGHEKYQERQKIFAEQIGNAIMDITSKHYPNYRLFSKQMDRKVRANPEGIVTEYVFQIKTKNGKNRAGTPLRCHVPHVFSKVFPLTLIEIDTSDGLMGGGYIFVNSEEMRRDTEFLREIKNDIRALIHPDPDSPEPLGEIYPYASYR